jgi:hypothetical protein
MCHFYIRSQPTSSTKSPTKVEKKILCDDARITNIQLRNWFTNIRKRHFRPTLQKGRAPRSALDLAIQQQQGKVKLMETHMRRKKIPSTTTSTSTMFTSASAVTGAPRI